MNDKLLTRQQLAEMLQISERQIARLEQDGLPAITLGTNTKRYNYDTVVLWLELHKSNYAEHSTNGSTIPLDGTQPRPKDLK